MDIKNVITLCYTDLNGEEIIATFHGKELQKTNQQ